MNSLFSKSSLMILESLSFTKTLYAFDFDGTLSKIVRDPTQALIPRATELLLRELSCLVPVAIISGRSLKDLKEKVTFEPQFLIGNHGLIGLDHCSHSLKEAEIISQSWIKAFTATKLGQGIEIENKIYSIAIHFRHSRQKKIAKNQIQNVISSLVPIPRVILGKSVFNLIPPGSPHKGIALLELMFKAGVKNAFYIGDDDTDEDVFSLPNNQIMTVRVGQKRSSSARYYIDHQSQINKLLKTLIRFQLPEKHTFFEHETGIHNACL